MKLAKDFKQFLLRGNVVDLAIAVVIGAVFGAVVTALVGDLVTLAPESGRLPVHIGLFPYRWPSKLSKHRV